MATDSRFDRQERLFGKEGQGRLEAVRVAIVGIGGLGCHVNQQVAYLGVRHIALIDDDIITRSSLNRVVGATPADVDAATKKIEVAARLIAAIDPSVEPHLIPHDFRSTIGFREIQEADYVFGCIDDDVARLALTELCAAYARPCFDLATDTGTDEFGKWFGGRVLLADGNRCVVCLDLLDQEQMRERTASEGAKREDEEIYGVRRGDLGDRGPSVVSLNSVVASAAAVEFMVTVTGLRDPQPHLEYDGRRGVIRSDRTEPRPDCYYCKGVWGKRKAADAERHIRSN
jgi:molybdopterin/thiamine biosynthesis adenylyltransferase